METLFIFLVSNIWKTDFNDLLVILAIVAVPTGIWLLWKIVRHEIPEIIKERLKKKGEK